MMGGRRNSGWVVVASVLGTLGALIIAGLIVVYTGSYDTAASSEHIGISRWALETTMERSVRRRASGLEPPADVSETDVAAGAAHYRDVCQHCHGGPGVRRDEWAQGLNPSPPDLMEEAGKWSSGELFWIVKHGIRMTGMPAIAEGHSDRDVWNIVAFVERLPDMSVEEYRAAGGAAGEQQDGHTGHTH
jgi:mono/diheme cytochrome c family protein